MIAMYFFKVGITTKQFNYWCTLCVGITVLLRDILFPPQLANYPLHLACLTLAVLLVLMLTFFYARKDWKTYSKRNLWMICIVDMILAMLYNINIVLEPTDEYTAFLLTEIWIRPTITYGMAGASIELITVHSDRRAAPLISQSPLITVFVISLALMIFTLLPI